jgi:hypothetical protein
VVAGFLGCLASSTEAEAGKTLFETFGKIGVNAFVLFFKKNGQGHNLGFWKSVKVFS